MPSYDQMKPNPKKGNIIKSAFDSDSFEADGTIHVDGLVGSASISPSGRDVALASPDGLAIIDLDSPYNPPRRLRSHGLPWLVVDVQWSPFAARDYWIVSTANHRALVWNLNLRDDTNSGAIEHSLQGHSRAITDINFSAHHPDLLSTCSVDGYVHGWDLRRPRQPVVTFCDWVAGATQVKYSRQDPHILASSHDRWLHIWDDRRASEPVRSISAHTSKIYGLDWNRTERTSILTCSLDKSIKFWDYASDSNQPKHVINTDYPVWRARHAPFGSSLLAMPQNEPGNLYLYDLRWPDGAPAEDTPAPVAVFPGHGDHKVKEFLWRSRGSITENNEDERDFQLVTWGTDNDLRLQSIDASIDASVGHVKGAQAKKGLILTRKGATYKTFRTVDEGSHRDKRQPGTMSDPRAGVTGLHYKQSALTQGMRSSGSTNRRIGPAWRGPSMKARIARNRETEKSQSQIGWMKGITMTKRNASSGLQKRNPSRDSDIFSQGFPGNDWGEPDTIQEELLRISTQIPKVKLEDIDMDSLTLNASLNGPWGVNGETIFIQVKIDIPSSYPKLKAPKFIIEKTSFMPEESHKKMDREVHQLARQFLQRKKNCLEGAFTYLLGEVDLESSTTLFKNVSDLDDDLGALADDSSSSESDEDIPAGGSASMSQELVPPGPTDAALATNRLIVPPSPRTCGARFSPDGRLICFFPSKEEKARALFSTSVETSKDRPKGEPFFAGFGRITHDLPPRQKFATDDGSATDDQSDESDSDNSSTSSSSDSESTSIHKMNLWYRSSRQLRKTWSEDRSARSSGGGTGTGVGTGTGTGTGISRRRPGRPRNLVCIYDLRPELPSKKELAQEYAIFGDGADVCQHNAEVARRHGCVDLVDVWNYLALLLRTGIPLEILTSRQRHDSILVIAHEAVSREQSKGEQHDPDWLFHDQNLSGRVKWGQHPLAKDFLVDLFDHYERMADIQMLAMLSCVFSESTAEDSVAYMESQLPQPETPLPLKAPSFSLNYYPTDASIWNLYGRTRTNSAATTPGALHTPVQFVGSQGSEEAMWEESGSNPHSCGETPPGRWKSHMGEADGLTSGSKSPSTRAVQRANSGLASSFTANLPRAFTGTSSASPPSHSKKRPSPAEMILSSFAPSTSNTTGWGDSSGGRNSVSDDDHRRDDTLPLVPVDVSVVIENQTMFDDDGWLNTPLLEPSRHALYANYRYVYAEMLHMWQQPLARLEIMKFNVLHDDASSTAIDETAEVIGTGSHHKTHSSPIPIGKKDQLSLLHASGRGLDVTGICRIHETQLEPTYYTSADSKSGGGVGTCDRCHRMQSQLRCVYCMEPVDALYPPCLSCGCASHEECLAEWHAAGETFCPAGDECNCVKEASNGQVESWEALQGAMLKGLKQMARLPSAIDDSDTEEMGRRRDHRNSSSSTLQSKLSEVTPSPASLSFGRFKKSASDWSRASSAKRTGGRG